MNPAHDLMDRLAAADRVDDAATLSPEQQRDADALLQRVLATPVDESARRANRRWPQLAAATALAAAVVFAALSLLDSDEGPGRNVLAQAVAALTQENAVYHAELIARAHSSDMPAANQKIFFESWHTTDGRTHTKTYAVKDGGKGRQYDDFAGRRRPGRLSGPALRYDPASNTILHSGFGRIPGVHAPQVDPFAPGTGLKELEAQGRLRVAGRVHVDGKSVYRLVSDAVRTSGGSVERSAVLVDPDTYLPLEQRLFVRNEDGTTMSIVWRYLTYERLPLNDETRSLLALDPHPGAKCAPGAGEPPRHGSLGFPNPCAP
jgi:hypothetical protein